MVVYAVGIHGYIDTDSEDEARKIAYELKLVPADGKLSKRVRFEPRYVSVERQEEP